LTVFALSFLACTRNAGSATSRDQVVVDKMESLKDGESISYKLEPGMYKLELTASSDGASVEWVGPNCPGTRETKTLSTVCEFTSTGQLVVKNPTTFGLGAPTTATVKLTKLGR